MSEKNTNQGVMWDRMIVWGAVILGIAIIVLAIVFGKGSGTGNNSDTSIPTDRTGLEITNEQVLGNPQASSTIVAFVDFQCVACVQFFKQFEPQLRSTFIDTGKAKMYTKTLSFIDGSRARGESFQAARAAQCAADQGKFWQMHDAIFGAEASETAAGKNNENSGNLTRDAFMGFAQQIGLDTNAFSSCFDSEKYIDLTSEHLKDANAALQGQVATPSVFVNGVKIKNPFSMDEYKALIK